MGKSKLEPGLTNDSIAFNRENNSRVIRNRFSLSFSALTKESTRISVSSFFATFPRAASRKKEASQCHWPSLCNEKFIEEQSIEEDILPLSTSSSSQATSALCFVHFPTTAAGYLSYEYDFNILGLKQLDQLETNLKNMFMEKSKGNHL